MQLRPSDTLRGGAHTHFVDISYIYAFRSTFSFHRGSCFEHSGAWLNMDQVDPINNRTVKFVNSCCVVSKQVEISMILVSIESTSPWLRAGTFPVFVRYVVLEIYLHSMFFPYNISRTT